VKDHAFFQNIDWQVVSHQKYPPPLTPPRGEVNAADAFDIGSFDEEDTKGIKLTENDQELYKDFPLVISERWQAEVAETVFDAINAEADRMEQKRRTKHKLMFDQDEKGNQSPVFPHHFLIRIYFVCATFFRFLLILIYFTESDCILHGYIKKLGGLGWPAWQTRYAKLYPNRIELHTEGGKPDLIFMDNVDEVSSELVNIKGEQCILLRTRDNNRTVQLTNPVSFVWFIGLFVDLSFLIFSRRSSRMRLV
jgi:beta-adrenergic-receptor kinase